MTLRSIPSQIGHLSDVDTTTTAPATDDALVWDGTNWVPGAGSGGGATSVLVSEAAPNSLYVNGEEAIYDPVTDRTFYTWTGADRDLYASYYDHALGEVGTPALVAAAVVAADDNHGAPSIALLADGTILIAWGTSSSGSAVQLSRSTSPRDISSWSTTSSGITSIYPTLIVLDDGTVLLFGHAGSGTAVARRAVWRSTDDGVTWGSATDIIDTTGLNANPVAYVFPMTLAADGLVHMSWTVGESTTTTRPNIYHATYDPDTGTMRNAAGSDLGTTVTSAEHPDCLAFTGTSVRAMQHTIFDDGRIFIVFNFGTDGSGQTGTYTVRVTRWDGSSWSTDDTGAASPWRFTHHQVVPYKDTILGLFCERTGTFTDLALWTFDQTAETWHRLGVLLEGDTGEGYSSVMVPLGGGPVLAVADQMPTGYVQDASVSANLVQWVAAFKPAALDDHTHPDLVVSLPDETIFAPDYTVTDGTSLDLAITFVWGVDATGAPYYNAAGVSAGEEAVLVLDNATGSLSLRPVEV